MGKIVYLMGKSASGKDTLYDRLLKDGFGQPIVMYTTRPVRSGEKDGEAYHFVDEEELARLEEKGVVVERRDYHTVHGIWTYFTVADENLDPERQDYLALGTPESFRKMCSYFGPETVIPVYLEVEDGERLSRALSRERSQEHPDYAEMCRRYLSDREDFSEEKLVQCGIHRRFPNYNFEDCVKEVEEWLLSMRS